MEDLRRTKNDKLSNRQLPFPGGCRSGHGSKASPDGCSRTQRMDEGVTGKNAGRRRKDMQTCFFRLYCLFLFESEAELQRESATISCTDNGGVARQE